ncbi:MAG: DUF563 domain-containing protein [Granulosicoccus sp.]|nr:DUF563 domain-containing protein [Granulosicoccus sp.]
MVAMHVSMPAHQTNGRTAGSVHGRDGWLFEHAALELLAGLPDTRNPDESVSERSDSIVALWRERLLSDTASLGQRGIRHIHLCVPDKLSILHGLRPAGLDTTDISPMRLLTARYKSQLPALLDPSAYLTRQQDNFPLYWKRDSRWSPWACFMSYQLLCGQLSVNLNKELLGYPFDETVQAMNLASEPAGEDDQLIRTYRLHLRSRRRFANELTSNREKLLPVNHPALSQDRYGQGAQVVFENRHPDASDLCVMLFGDANSADSRTLLSGMLAETFSEVHFVWSQAIDLDYIDQVRPDVVISQASELQMARPPVAPVKFSAQAAQSLQNLQQDLQNGLLISPNPSGDQLQSTAEGSAAATLSRRLLPAEEYQLPPPVVLQAHPPAEQQDTRMLSNEVHLAEVKQARVYFTGPEWLVHDESGQEVLRHGLPDSQQNAGRWTRRQTLNGLTLMFASSAGAHCYYHWMLEILPKLGLLEREGISLDSIDHFLVRRISGDWQRQTLARFGIHDNRIVETEKQPHLNCERLLHIDLNCGINLKMHRFIPQWMKHLYPVDTANQPRLKLYISRPEGVRRGISNEQVFLPMLREAGFTIMAMEGMSVAQQAALLARADVLMSPHGGALTNMVFCRPGITVIELFSRHVFPYYYGLAANCGHQYHAILENPAEDYARLVSGKIAQSHADTQHETAVMSFEAPVEAIRQVLQSIGALPAKC